MRFAISFFLVFFSVFFGYSQKLTGIWRGNFVQRDFNGVAGKWIDDSYKYEIQIHQLTDQSVEGVTYSYKNKIFYGKSSFKGIFTKATNNLLLKEIKMLELKISDNSVACLMTCYLDYSKEGKVEKLSGTYTSMNPEEKRSCGEGIVYLERVKLSDFKKEDFLLPAPTIAKKTPAISPSDKVGTKKNSSEKSAVAGSVIKNKQLTSKPITNNTTHLPIPKKDIHSAPLLSNEIVVDSFKKDNQPIEKHLNKQPLVIPKILQSRENKLINTIIVDQQNIQIDYYDNGEIDNDTISVYHNYEKIINHGRLSDAPLSIKLHVDEANPIHELITVAENLGDVPPNTALMVITAGKKRYEIFLSSDEVSNAKVIIQYQPNKKH